MEKSLFFYDLPQELIAQHPAVPRDSSRLMCLNKVTGETSDAVFSDIASMLKPNDLLVVNDSKVLPARLLGSKIDSGGSVEILLLRDLGNDVWDCLVKPGKRLRVGARAVFGDGVLEAEIIEETADGNRNVRFSYDKSKSFFELLDEVGTMPLPHYITEPIKDNDEYQTVYAEHIGSAAAPTAGLHFTEELLEKIKSNGTGLARVTLHVGLGTFRPVKEKDITKHLMHREWYTLTRETADAINETKKNGGRVIAVGTTSCRTLEAVFKDNGAIVPCSDSTDIFIYPGYKFGAIDALITNFHLPESTLIMLVSAFAGYENTMNAYKRAVAERYRFFSFGDAMFIS